MPAPAKLPDGAELERLAEAGISQAEIARRFDVSQEAVRQAYKRAGVQPAPAPGRYKSFIPWKVKTKDNLRYELRMLRWYARLMTHGTLPEQPMRLLKNWMNGLDRLNRVVDYDPTRPEGFYYRPAPAGHTAAELGYIWRED